jgi:maltooligosyltrehalose synthase
MGNRSENVVAFLRHYGSDWALVIAPKWLAGPTAEIDLDGQERLWKDDCITLPADAPPSWKNVFTCEELNSEVREGQKSFLIGNLLRHFPVALLRSSSIKTADDAPSL